MSYMSNLHCELVEKGIDPETYFEKQEADKKTKAIVNTHESIMEIINQGLKNI